MTSVIKHSLRATAGAFGGYRPEGWSPRVQAVLRGPVPAGTEVVWAVQQPGGSPWFEHRVGVSELGADECTTVQLQHLVDGVDIAAPGMASFTLRLVSELDGTDEPLHSGGFAVVQLEGEHRFAVDNEWMIDLALLALDTRDEPDAPPLVVSVFVAGEGDAYEYEAHLFFDGIRLAEASAVESRYEFTSNDGVVIGRELAVSFDTVRGWNNLRASGWGDGWHLLDANDGAYEVKVLCASKVVRVVPFEVIGGRVVAPGVVEFDPAVGAVMLLDAAGVPGAVRTREPTAAFYGDAVTASAWGSIDDVYARRVQPPAVDPPAFDDDTADALRAFFDRVERLVNTWEADMIETAGPYDHAQVLGAEAVLAERPGYVQLAEAAAEVPDDYVLELNHKPTTAEELRVRVPAIFAAAEARIAGAAQHDSAGVAPYRALLNRDKLAVFDDHPAPDFLYTTTGRRIIETPEELAAAEHWFFEAPLDLPGSATVDGVRVDVTVQGWRVEGWRFAPDGSMLDHFETQGQGASAPLEAFEHAG